MVDVASRTEATIDLLRRAIEKERSGIDGRNDLRAVQILVRFDRRTGDPFVADVRPQYETS
jgi:hypothetical protein